MRLLQQFVLRTLRKLPQVSFQKILRCVRYFQAFRMHKLAFDHNRPTENTVRVKICNNCNITAPTLGTHLISI